MVLLLTHLPWGSHSPKFGAYQYLVYFYILTTYVLHYLLNLSLIYKNSSVMLWIFAFGL